MKREEVAEISISLINPDPENLRKTFDEEDLKALAQNLLEHGQLDPVQVFEKDDGTYDLWDGERRWRAAQIAPLRSLKAIIVPRPSPVDLLCRKISRAMQTRILSFPEEVRALEEGLQALQVFDQPDKWSLAAKKLGVTPSILRERMRITKLSSRLRKEFEDGKLDYSLSQTLGKIDNHKLQERIAEFVVKEGLSNRFAVLRFIPEVLENPARSLMESYDISKAREKYRYAAPRKKEDVPPRIEDRIDEMLEDFRKCIRWVEAAGRQNLISFLTPSNFNTRRVLATLRHLHHMIAAFMSAYQSHHGAEENARVKKTKELPASLKLLKDAGIDEEQGR